MDDSLAGLTAQPRPFTVGGRAYLIHPLQLEDFGAMQVWCDTRQPSPYESVSKQLGKGLFTVAQERALLDAAIRVATGPKPQIGSPECDAVIGTVEGLAKMIQLAIRRGDPKFSEEDALKLVKSLDVARLAELQELIEFDAAIGGREAEDGGPKGPAGGASSTRP